MTLLSVFIFALGAILGSFLNVLIYRLPREQGVASPVPIVPIAPKPLPGTITSLF